MEPAVQGSPSSAAAQASPSSGESGVSARVHATVLSQALLAHQVPPLPVFSGEGYGIGGSFSEWHEQLEMVASMCQWSEQVKLVTIATRLKGEAYAFYRSCTSTQRASYPLLGPVYTNPDSVVNALKSIRFGLLFTRILRKRTSNPQRFENAYQSGLVRIQRSCKQ